MIHYDEENCFTCWCIDIDFIWIGKQWNTEQTTTKRILIEREIFIEEEDLLQ